ncbi:MULTISPECIES: choline kinase family protein [unclassified Rhizobium]|uniref:choline kinase family protein n=1 Tax=unclassified Rhizobium TaxID=2613769 RepID=UPI000645E11B|nr:choline kinase family protein [Rhizobium sp. WW_1]RKD74078.1 thiamine kinase-like enzyme [Rhizobium sp. WW_1]
MAKDDLQGAVERIESLKIWNGNIDVSPLAGGLTNRNYRVVDGPDTYVVRFGDDIPVHGVMRFNEAAAATAAYHAGVSPEVVHAVPGMMVSRFVTGATLTPSDVRNSGRIERIVGLIKQYHTGIGDHYTGPVLAFWVFQVVRSYIARLRREGSRLVPRLEKLAAHCRMLESSVGPVDIVFSHNDLLAANFIDDGKRLWVLDWDYAGLNTPLFDLANLSSNNEFDASQDVLMLETYYGEKPDGARVRALHAMKCASLLREALWSAISEHHSEISFDYETYTEDYLQRLEKAMARLSA